MEVIFDSTVLNYSQIDFRVSKWRPFELPNPNDTFLHLLPLNEHYYVVNAPKGIEDDQLSKATSLAKRATAFLGAHDDLDLNPANKKPDLDQNLARFTHDMEHVATAEYILISRRATLMMAFKRFDPYAITLVTQPVAQERNFPGVMFTFNRQFTWNTAKQDRAVRNACMKIAEAA